MRRALWRTSRRRGRERCERDAQRVKARGTSAQGKRQGLTREVLERKLTDLKARVEDYGARRPAEPALASDLDAAKEILASAQSAEKAALDRRERAERAFELTRESCAKQEKAEGEGATKWTLAADGIERAQNVLIGARAAKGAEKQTLERGRRPPGVGARGRVRRASRRLAAEDPDVRTSRRTLVARNRRRPAPAGGDELLEVATTLKTHGEDGLEERRAPRRPASSASSSATGSRGRPGKLLFETLRQTERGLRSMGSAREQIEKLGRYVFEESFGGAER